MQDITVIGIDLAKDIFQLHGANSAGKQIMSKRLTRKKLIEFMSSTPACLVGMEACGTAHYWARKFVGMGHEVKLMSPQFVKPYVKTNKNDYNDAQAIAEAVTRPTMRFVPRKSIEQQSVQALHRTRSLLMKHRTALGNHIRGILLEFGITIPLGLATLQKKMPDILEDAENELIDLTREQMKMCLTQISDLSNEIEKMDKKINTIASQNTNCQRIMEIEGVGALTATAIVAAVGNANDFKNGREMAAWLGLVPRQRSSGKKNILLGISKRGDRYLRTLLIHGGRAVVRTCENKNSSRMRWVQKKKQSIGVHKTAVAVANKNARIIWALLAHDQDFIVN